MEDGFDLAGGVGVCVVIRSENKSNKTKRLKREKVVSNWRIERDLFGVHLLRSSSATAKGTHSSGLNPRDPEDITSFWPRQH